MAMEMDADSTSPSLTLYVVLHSDDVAECMRSGRVPIRFATSPKKRTIGLREKPEQAVIRYRLIFGSSVKKDSLAMLAVTFTTLGIAHYATEKCSQEDNFCSRLSKRTYYSDTTTDWGSWDFVGDLSLQLPQFLTCSWSTFA